MTLSAWCEDLQRSHTPSGYLRLDPDHTGGYLSAFLPGSAVRPVLFHPASVGEVVPVRKMQVSELSSHTLSIAPDWTDVGLYWGTDWAVLLGQHAGALVFEAWIDPNTSKRFVALPTSDLYDPQSYWMWACHEQFATQWALMDRSPLIVGERFLLSHHARLQHLLDLQHLGVDLLQHAKDWHAQHQFQSLCRDQHNLSWHLNPQLRGLSPDQHNPYVRWDLVSKDGITLVINQSLHGEAFLHSLAYTEAL